MEDIKQAWKEICVQENSPYQVWNRYHSDAENKKSKIAFLHIPKTGGRQVDNIVMAAKEANGEPRQKFFVKHLNRGMLEHTGKTIIESENEDEFVDFIGEFNYVSQHFTGRQFDLIGDDFFKVSLVREPFARFRSHFLQSIYSNEIDLNDDMEMTRIVEDLLENYSNIFLNTYAQYCDVDCDSPDAISEIYKKFDFLCSVSYMDHMISSALGSHCKFYILSKNQHYSSVNNKRFAKRFLQKWMPVFFEKNMNDLMLYKFIEKTDKDRQVKIKRKTLNKQIIVPPIKYFARPKSIYLRPKPFSISDNYRNPKLFGSIFDVYKIK